MLALENPNGTESWSAMFTKNAFPGSPVIVGRDLLAAGYGEGDNISSRARLRGICVNNKVSNVFPGSDGVQDAKDVAAAALSVLPGTSSATEAVNVLPSSTGVIGWQIPVKEMIDEMPALADSLQPDSILPAARGIMTTDLYPKVRSVEIPCANGTYWAARWYC